MEKGDVGVVGLGVMGYGFAMNFEDKGYSVSITNWEKDILRKLKKTETNRNLIISEDLEGFVQSLDKPRKIFLFVKAGKPTENTINKLIPLLDKGDILIDGGNTHYKDSINKTNEIEKYGIYYIGMGVSGGEEGARHGASLMPGGSPIAYKQIELMLSEIAAKAPQDDEPCVTYIGPKGSGHFTKIVHNGIEYGDIQLIAEAYFIMRYSLNLPVEKIAGYFKEWNAGELNSYLIEITSKILSTYDDKTGKPMVDVILDRAGSKGTGKWASQIALDLHMPLSVTTEAVFIRYLSELKEQRIEASKILTSPNIDEALVNVEEYVEQIRRALYFAKIISYAQGFALYSRANEEYGWKLDNYKIAKIFRSGCVIRAELLDKIANAYQMNNKLSNILQNDYFSSVVNSYQEEARTVVADAIKNGVPVTGLASAIGYFDNYRLEKISANLIQAQRDYFGAHTFERVDEEGSFHHNW